MLVSAVELSKTGKSYNVKLDNGRYYTCKARGIEQAQGRDIECEFGAFVLPSGDKRETIEAFTYSTKPVAPAAVLGSIPAVLPGAQMAPSWSPAKIIDRWWMPFVSNTVAHAIAAGCLTKPGDIEYWAAAAYLVAIDLGDSLNGE